MRTTSHNHELYRLISLAVAGEASDAELQKLYDMIDSDESVRRAYVEFITLQAHLSWLHFADVASENETAQPATAACGDSAEPHRPTIARAGESDARQSSGRFVRRYWPRFSMAAAALVLVGMGIGLVVSGHLLGVPGKQVADNRNGGLGTRAPEVTGVVGEWAGVVNCSWFDESGVTPIRDRSIRVGEEIALLQGVASLRLADGVDLQVDGPTALVIASRNSIVMQYGALVGKIGAYSGPLEVAIPSGRLRIDSGEFGLKVIGEHIEVHALAGSVVATLNPFGSPTADPELFGPDAPLDLVIQQGKAVRFMAADGSLRIAKEFAANRNRFATMIPMDSPLDIPPQYVAAIHASEPLGYWRFGLSGSNTVFNEQSSFYQLDVLGQVSFSSCGDNDIVEFGADDAKGLLVSDAPLTELNGKREYTLECWYKPSHFHHGLVVGLIDKPESNPHAGVIVELQPGLYDPGPRSGRIRFLHRSPPAGGTGGEWCFSKHRYALRRWQHVVAVGTGTELCLYVNGKLVAKSEQKTPLAGDLHVVCGQHPLQIGVRQFVGQLDELAVYTRALSQKEIVEHFQAAPQSDHAFNNKSNARRRSTVALHRISMAYPIPCL